MPSHRSPRRLVGWLLVLALLPALSRQQPAGAAANTIYVVPGGAGSRSGADWANALDLQPALTGAAGGSEIWVKQGTYTPGGAGDRAASFQLRNGVALYGGFAGAETALIQRDPKANPTTLSGDLLANDIQESWETTTDNAYRVVNSAANDQSAVLDGFIIRAAVGGNQDGGGVAVRDGSPTLRNLIIAGNSAYHGGGLQVSNSRLTLSRVSIIKNRAQGWAAALLNQSSTITIADSIISGNSAQDMAAIASSGTLFISNSVVNNNGARYCGVIYSAGSVTVVQSTVANNGVGEGYNMCVQGSFTMRNSILWNDRQGLERPGPAITIEHSLVQGGYPGLGNLAADPEFIDPSNHANDILKPDGDLHVEPTSPAVNAGSNALIPADLADADGDGDTAEPAPFDFDGGPRVVFGTVDMGAYEVAAPPPACPAGSRLYVRPGAAGTGDGESWANAYADLAPALKLAKHCAGVAEIWAAGGTYKPGEAGRQGKAFNLRNGLAIYGGFAGTETALNQRILGANPSVLSGDLLGNDSGAVHDDNPTRLDNSTTVVMAENIDRSGILDGFTITAGNNRFTQGAALLITGGKPILRNLIFHRNAAHQGPMSSVSSDFALSRAVFTENMAFDGGGAIFIYGGAPTISQAIFNGNRSRYGGAIYSTSTGSTTIRNSTFVANQTENGGAIRTLSGAVTLDNSIVWGNAGAGVSGSVTVSHSLVQGGAAGTGNLNVDPLFADIAGTDAISGTLDDDLRLRPESPAVNAGSNGLIGADFSDSDGDGDSAEPAPLDLAGNPRLIGGQVDLGAYELTDGVLSAPPHQAVYGSSYSHQFSASEPVSGTYQVRSGDLPPGLSLDPASGLLAGAPTATGAYTAEVSVSTTVGLASQLVTITVAPAPLTVTANDAQRAPGAANPAFTVRYAGFVLGDDAGDLGGQPACATTASAASPPGSYPITCSPGGLASPNYALSFAPGTLTITPFQIAIPLIMR